MRDYGKVSAQFWIGTTGKALRGDPAAQVLALYLMTCPHSTMTGVYHCPVLYMAHETGLGMEGATKALARLMEVGFCEFDDASEFVFVLRMAAHQIGDDLKPNDKRVVGLKKQVELMPAPLKARFLDLYGESFLLLKADPPASPIQAPSEPLRSQEQEQEQEQKSRGSPARGSRLGVDSLPDEWATFCRAERRDLDPAKTFDAFRDYWQAQPGRKGVKADWFATWRNWVRNERLRPAAQAEAAKSVGSYL